MPLEYSSFDVIAGIMYDATFEVARQEKIPLVHEIDAAKLVQRRLANMQQQENNFIETLKRSEYKPVLQSDPHNDAVAEYWNSRYHLYEYMSSSVFKLSHILEKARFRSVQIVLNNNPQSYKSVSNAFLYVFVRYSDYLRLLPVDASLFDFVKAFNEITLLRDQSEYYLSQTKHEE